MSASNSLPAITLCLSCVGFACEPKPSGATAEPAAASSEPAPSTPPVADQPVAEQPAAEKPADGEAPPTKCFTDGGTCVHKKATLECRRFEEGEQWGCTDENTGCCFQ